MNRDASEIAVIGAGVVGLTTAFQLLQRGARVRIYAQQIDEPPASSAAPALFTPYPGPARERFRRWTRQAFERLSELARSAPESGVVLGTLREYCYSSRASEPWLDDLLQTLRLPPRPPFVEIAQSVRPHVDMLRFLPWLRVRVVELGGSLVSRPIASFDELFALGHRCIVNCTGFGAAALTHDPLLRPMHGQVLHAPNDIGLECSLHDDAPGGLVAYIFRLSDRLVIGSTFDQGREHAGTDEQSLRAILGRARELLRLVGHPRWRDLGRTILQARAAHRPARGRDATFEDIRLEVELLESGRRIVHNYGHGRMGVTLAWATGADAAATALGGTEG
jgi:D-amino-acid oxidase